MKLNTHMLAIAVALGTTTIGFAQNPLGDALQGARAGAAQSLSQSAGQALNNTLGVPQTSAGVTGNAALNAGINQGVPQSNQGFNAGANTNGAFNSGGSVSGQSVVGNTVQGLINGQSFGAAVQNSLDMNANGYRLNGQLNTQLQQQYGFQPGDVIVNQHGQPVRDTNAWNQWVQSSNGYYVQRDGQVVQLGLRAGNSNWAQSNSGQQNPRRLGITMESTQNAAIVSRIDQNSLAAQAGLRVGDRIVSFNGQTVANPYGLMDYVAASNGGDVNIVVDRNGRRETLVARFDGHAQVTNSNSSGAQNGQASSHDYESLSLRVGNIERMLAEIQQSLNIRASANVNAEANNPNR